MRSHLIPALLGLGLLLSACSDDTDCQCPQCPEQGVCKDCGVADRGGKDQSKQDQGKKDMGKLDGKPKIDQGPPKPDTQPWPIANIIISEMMIKPGTVVDTEGEWIELYNPETFPVDLTGWVLKDLGGENHTFDKANGQTTIDPKKYLVIGLNKDPTINGGVEVLYKYSKLYMEDNDALVLIDKKGVMADTVEWTIKNWTGKIVKGASVSLKDLTLDNSKVANWCLETAKWASSKGDKGTPGKVAGCK